jgi:hypothetical protein
VPRSVIYLRCKNNYTVQYYTPHPPHISFIWKRWSEKFRLRRAAARPFYLLGDAILRRANQSQLPSTIPSISSGPMYPTRGNVGKSRYVFVSVSVYTYLGRYVRYVQVRGMYSHSTVRSILAVSSLNYPASSNR